MSSMNRKTWWPLLACVALASCASQRPLEARKLPYHVAVLPIDSARIGSVSPGELPGEETELRLEFDPAALTQALEEALSEYCFTRVTVLEPSEGEPGDSFGRATRLLARAEEVEADLIVEFGLRYDAEVYRKNAGTFWLNFPLFLFAGPSNWFVGDNVYFADVDLSTSVYDRNVIEAGGLELGEPTARVLTTSSRFNGADLDFVDRSGGAEDYALGILIPSGYLSRESETACAGLHAEIVEELRRQLVQGLQSRRGELVQADWIAPFHIEPEELQLAREGEELHVVGSVHLGAGGEVNQVHAIHLETSAGSCSLRFDEDSLVIEGGERRQPFEARLPAPSEGGELRLICEVGTRDRYVRSYTVPLP